MEREIKFRAIVLDDDNGDRIENNVWPVGNDRVFVERGGFYMDYSVLMQYTGLKDKNGNEIYEGDVLSFEGKFQYYVVFEDAKFVCKHAAQSNSMQGLTWGALHRFFDPDFLVYGGVEVIGNIYEHPDLIKK